MMAEFLTIVTSQWIWDVLADLDEVITNFDFCRYLGCVKYNICINVCIIKIHVPRAHEVKNQRVIAKRTSQTMKYGQDVIIQKRTDDNIQ